MENNVVLLKNTLVFLDLNILAQLEREKLKNTAEIYRNTRVAAVCVKNYMPGFMDWFMEDMKKNQIPVILLPKDMILSTVISGISYEIFYAKGYNFVTSYEDNFLQEMIFAEQDRQIMLKRARMMGIRVNEYLCAILLRPGRCLDLPGFLNDCRKAWKQPCFISSRNGIIMLIGRSVLPYAACADYFSEHIQRMMAELREHYPGMRISVGVGHCYENVVDLRKSYYGAKTALLTAATMSGLHNIAYYDRLGIYKILFDMKNRNELIQISDSTAKMLLHYDEQNQTEFFETVRVYLEQFCSVQGTASAMFVHYNTIRYRINKIKELFHWDLFNWNDCVYLSVGLKAYEYIKKEDEL